MGIISVSLNDDALAELDKIQQTYQLKGRSEAVRTSIKAAAGELQDLADFNGEIEGVLIVIRHDHSDPWMSIIEEKHESAIKTQLHSHLENRRCLEVMVIGAPADEFKAMMKEIEGVGKADYIRFVRS
ncbi:MAG: CopG family transcriptional regulator [Candidatus Methanomethylophilus sp.]|nr:CopG family transcriptional regulator [Methanomethylophilus sp.]MDD3233408.1 CopG family transcriptional regulator [Methanomethylophilus sp.]MDD4221898.1 CopG family transcriptional regulator [Methanomethylophilus sp.]MDD4668752.1 CopG family transcriptional regulator [Methanomethylophilus sp.]